MKYVLFVALGLVVLVVVIIGIGYSLPVKHRAARSALLSASTDVVFTTISNYAAFPELRSVLKSVENIARTDGKTGYREIGSDGTITYVVEESTPSVRLVTRIDDKSLPFGGTWTFQLAGSAEGTTLVITEDGEVYNPLFRFMSKYVFGHSATIETYLSDLGKRFPK